MEVSSESPSFYITVAGIPVGTVRTIFSSTTVIVYSSIGFHLIGGFAKLSFKKPISPFYIAILEKYIE